MMDTRPGAGESVGPLSCRHSADTPPRRRFIETKDDIMSRRLPGILIAVCASAVFSANACTGGAPAPAEVGASTTGAAVPKGQERLLQWPVLPGNEAYAAIDGKHLHTYVVEHAEISRRYRDQGHPQSWGRLVGTSADEESVKWFLDKYKQIGLSDVHAQPLDLAPKWFPQSWEVNAVTGDGRATPLVSARPGYRGPVTPPGGLDLEIVNVGAGSESEFAGRDVRGKAVVIFDLWAMGSANGALQRAEAKGAAAIFNVITLPGNLQLQYTSQSSVPNFSLGNDDGNKVRDLIGQASAGKAPHLKIRLDAKEIPNLKSALVWGTLPGATDETIYVLAHRDGWFDASIDNGGGISQQIGLAEYFAKVPQAQRRRTIVFVATDGHHAPGQITKDDPTGEGGEGEGRTWLRLQGEKKTPMLAKTALFINCEHPSAVDSIVGSKALIWSNTTMPNQWYAGGPSRPKLQALAAKVFAEFGVSTYAEPQGQKPPYGELGFFYHITPGLVVEALGFHYFHTDLDTPEAVPWTGLESTTRAYAKMIDEVNKIELKDLLGPREGRPDELMPEAIERATRQPTR
jgi:hypothetical protein